MLTYFGKRVLQLKRSAEESWPMYPSFCMTMHLLHWSHKLQCSNADLKKCVIDHILLTTWHQAITICCQIWTRKPINWWGSVKRVDDGRSTRAPSFGGQGAKMSKILYKRKCTTWITVSKTVNLFRIGWTIIEKSRPEHDKKWTH